MTETNKLPRAVAEGVLLPGELDAPCAVLDDGRRVLTARGMISTLTGGGAKDGKMGRNLERLQPYLPADRVRPSEFISLSGSPAHAYDAQALVDVCRALSRLRREGKLHHKQEHLADRAQLILEALAGVGVAALVDEATGYQDRRPPGALQRLLAMFVRDKAKDGLAEWELCWPESLDRKLCALYRQPFEPGKRPPWLRSVRLKIYRIVQGREVVEKIQADNPNPSHGSNHHQHLTGPARKLLDADLRVVEDYAEQFRTPEEFYARLEWKFNRKPFQHDMGWE